MSDEGKSEVRFSPERSDRDIIQAATKALREWVPMGSLHPARAVVAAVRPLILNQAADAINHLNLGVDDRQSPHLQRGESNGLHRAENWLRDDALRDAARAVGVGGQHTDTPHDSPDLGETP